MVIHVEESRAVETYLLNFTDGKAHCQTILEMTLYYGMQCLSQSFALKGMSCHDLRVRTGVVSPQVCCYDIDWLSTNDVGFL